MSIHALDAGLQTDQMIYLPKMLELARRLLSYEALPGNTAAPTEFAAVRVCEKLREPLCSLAGVAGYRALLSRALMLARAEAPWLSAMQVTADGSLLGPSEIERQIDATTAREGGIILLAHLLGLFLNFIGADLTVRLVRDVAPYLEEAPTESDTSMPSEALLQEVSQLNSMSKRLDSLAEQHPFVEEALMSISGNIRSTATIIEVLVLIRNKSNNLPKSAPLKQSKTYKM